VLSTKTSRLLADLGGSHADGTWESRLRRYLKPDLLILDDFAMKEFTLKQAEDIYELIDERSRSGFLVIASNGSPQDWYPLFPNPVLAEGVLDRLVNKAHYVMLTGKTYRPQLRPDRQKEVAEEVRGM
jgi:DNA replication protein DnaC